MRRIAASDVLHLAVAATGGHLSARFGMTVREIEADGFVVDIAVPILGDGDDDVAAAHAAAAATGGFADAWSRNRPDVVLLLGDRYEILAAATVALLLRIPVAHIAGGEVTKAAFDDQIRHAITKMASLHFVSAQTYRRRVIQMGERPDRVFLVGALGLDNVLGLDLFDRSEVEKRLGIGRGLKYAVVTFHPVTLSPETTRVGISAVLEALSSRSELFAVFTMPNADPDSRVVEKRIRAFEQARPGCCSVHEALGVQLYLSAVKHASVVIGNSSSGMAEAPALGTPVVNVGDRQQGRLRPSGVIDCEPTPEAVEAAIDRGLSSEFAEEFAAGSAMLGDGHAAERIVEVLERTAPDSLELAKGFRDLPDVDTGDG